MAVAGAMALCASAAAPALGQLRIATWNISFFAGGRMSDIRTGVYTQFNGRSMSPDILLVQEAQDASAIAGVAAGDEGLLLILNGAPGSPGDWAAAPFIDSPDSACIMLYRTSKVQFLGVTEIAVKDPGTTGQPRDTTRFDVRPVGYTTANSSIGIYNVHLKSGDGSADANPETNTPDNNTRRIFETRRIRSNIQGEDTNPTAYPNDGLPAGYNFIIAGDFNTQTSTQTAFQMLVAAAPAGTTTGGGAFLASGRAYDPINRLGSWNNNATYQMIHTQDPAGPGGMDDRHDMMLVGAGLLDQQGLEYIGALTGPQNPVPWDLSTCNDPNHSYRCWGNDGTSYNATLTIAGNAWVGATIAQALKNVANGSGHLPVYADFRVPARLGVSPGGSATINLGQVRRGRIAPTITLTITNDGDIAKWTAGGIANLNYSLAASPGFTVPGGPFVNTPGQGRQHIISMPTGAAGMKNGTLTITHNAGAVTAGFASYTLVGEVLPYCLADVATEGNSSLNAGPDGYVTGIDFDLYVQAYFTEFRNTQNVLVADVATAGSGAPVPDGFVTGEDFDLFVQEFFAGCP